jgi:holliday junction DNA helicase RuvA
VIAYIKGLLTQSSPLFVVVEAAGIGYKIFIPASLFARLPPIKEEVSLHTSFIVRELSQTLYGFLSVSERDLFEALMNVTGIGPKLALSIIGHLPGHALHQAIVNHDISTISKVPGIGKKTAERLIIEMRDKISTIIASDPSEFAVHMPSDPRAQQISDAMSALIHLGYNQNAAQKAIKKTLQEVPESIELSKLITAALKNLI